MPKTPSDVLKLVKERNCRVVDLKFMDFIGTWQHLQFPIHNLTEAAFEDGIPFDGSSIRAWQTIEASDMDLMPDPATAKIDPFMQETCISLI